MNALQQQISDLINGRHKQWHIEALQLSTYGDFGREYLNDQSWEFVTGFDTEDEAKTALAQIESWVSDVLPYGGDDYELRITERAA